MSAIFFDDVRECAEKLIHYLGRPDELQGMGAAAAGRVREAGYSEADFVRLVTEALSP